MTHEEVLELLRSNPHLNIFAVIDLGEAGEMLVPMDHERLSEAAKSIGEQDDAPEIPCNQMGEFLYVGASA